MIYFLNDKCTDFSKKLGKIQITYPNTIIIMYSLSTRLRSWYKGTPEFCVPWCDHSFENQYSKGIRLLNYDQGDSGSKACKARKLIGWCLSLSPTYHTGVLWKLNGRREQILYTGLSSIQKRWVDNLIIICARIWKLNTRSKQVGKCSGEYIKEKHGVVRFMFLHPHPPPRASWVGLCLIQNSKIWKLVHVLRCLHIRWYLWQTMCCHLVIWTKIACRHRVRLWKKCSKSGKLG